VQPVSKGKEFKAPSLHGFTASPIFAAMFRVLFIRLATLATLSVSANSSRLVHFRGLAAEATEASVCQHVYSRSKSGRWVDVTENVSLFAAKFGGLCIKLGSGGDTCTFYICNAPADRLGKSGFTLVPLPDEGKMEGDACIAPDYEPQGLAHRGLKIDAKAVCPSA